MSLIYEPSRSLSSRIKRRIVPYQAQNLQSVKLNRPIVSFTFDDCPLSAITNGLPQLEAKNWRSTVYLACGLFDTTNHLGLHMGCDDARAVHNNGHEIGDHTFSHIDASSCEVSDAITDIRKNQAELVRLGLPESETFAYPYGQATPELKCTLQTYFKGSRGIAPIVHRKSVDLNQVGSMPLFSGQSFDKLLREIKSLSASPAWMTIFTHDVRDTPSKWGTTPSQLSEIIDAVERSGAEVMPVIGAIKRLEYLEQ